MAKLKVKLGETTLLDIELQAEEAVKTLLGIAGEAIKAALSVSEGVVEAKETKPSKKGK
jgi:hypothetical protein